MTTSTTRKQGNFPAGGRTLVEAEAILAELLAIRVEATCNRCRGNGTSWWQSGTGTCIRCGGTGRAADGLRSAVAFTESKIAFFGTPAGRLAAWQASYSTSADPATAHHAAYRIVRDAITSFEWAANYGNDFDSYSLSNLTPTVLALLAAIIEGRQTKAPRLATLDAIAAERADLRAARSTR